MRQSAFRHLDLAGRSVLRHSVRAGVFLDIPAALVGKVVNFCPGGLVVSSF